MLFTYKSTDPNLQNELFMNQCFVSDELNLSVKYVHPESSLPRMQHLLISMKNATHYDLLMTEDVKQSNCEGSPVLVLDTPTRYILKLFIQCPYNALESSFNILPICMIRCK